ncbi:unnamed protein product [Oncorhynchus mykiss]|uniref:Helicase C-terminal domain-containing protein n=1 Tax=Oncorhynchus mykiss TaxID=8022 RepID=A0A060WVX6_ONCMY|nr:unnamed protein product [Oncorhynchus mykiss]
MATDSWAQAVGEQEAAAESVSTSPNGAFDEMRSKHDNNNRSSKCFNACKDGRRRGKQNRGERRQSKPQLLQGVYAVGFNRPSKIQENALPLMLAEPRLLLSWPCSVTSTPTTSFLSVCVSPTYELALQTGKVIEQMGKYSSEVKLVYAIRGNKHKAVGWLAGELSREGHQVALLSGEMQVEQRAAVIDRFREGREKVLVTNNVCARGYSSNHTNGSFECI